MKLKKYLKRAYICILDKAYLCMLTVLFLCMFAISCIRLHIPELWIENDNADAINEVLVNLSYSYIAGFVFFLFTVAFPNELKKQKMRNAISNKMSTISTKYKACLSSVVPLLERASFVYNEDNIKSQFEKTSLHSKSALSEVGQNYTVIHYIIAQHASCLQLIEQLLEYKDLLDSATLATIEDLRNPSFQGTLQVFTLQNDKVTLDRPDQRVLLAHEIFTQYEKSKKLKF